MTPLLASRPRADRAFERLYQRHVGDVYRYALAVLRNQADAEDVTQTTFLNAYRAFQRGERPQTAHNWLIAIAHNVCRQRFRQSARRPHEVEFEDDIALPVEEDEGPTAADIRRALGHLAFNQRAALVMRELEGRSYAEIGEILDVSVSAVETLIFRARRALREQLEGSLTCGEAELAISRQLDGRLARAEKGQLRAHLRECKDCATFARRQRAQRTALKSLVAVPLPTSLSSFFGGGPAVIGGGLAVKAAAVVAAGTVVGGMGYETAHKLTHHRLVAPTPVSAQRPAVPTRRVRAPRVDRSVRAAPAPFVAAHARKSPVHASVSKPNKGKAAKGQPPGQAVSAQHGKSHAKHATPVRAHGAAVNAHARGRSHAQAPHVKKTHVRPPKSHARHTPPANRSHGKGKPAPPPAQTHGNPSHQTTTGLLPGVSIPTLPDLPPGKK